MQRSRADVARLEAKRLEDERVAAEAVEAKKAKEDKPGVKGRLREAPKPADKKQADLF